MLTHILHNSPKLCAFLDKLDLGLYKPQRQHIEEHFLMWAVKCSSFIPKEVSISITRILANIFRYH
jgi:hypothetical protein